MSKHGHFSQIPLYFQFETHKIFTEKMPTWGWDLMLQTVSFWRNALHSWSYCRLMVSNIPHLLNIEKAWPYSKKHYIGGMVASWAYDLVDFFLTGVYLTGFFSPVRRKIVFTAVKTYFLCFYWSKKHFLCFYWKTSFYRCKKTEDLIFYISKQRV